MKTMNCSWVSPPVNRLDRGLFGFFMFVSFVVIIFASITLYSFGASPAQKPDLTILLFYQPGCIHCQHALDWFRNNLDKYGDVALEKRLLQPGTESFELLKSLQQKLDFQLQETPIIIIGNKVQQGWNLTIKEQLINYIRKGVKHNWTTPVQVPEEKQQKSTNSLAQQLTVPAVVIAALIDSINPCAFAVLVLLLGTFLVADSRRKIWQSGLAFIGAIFVSYLCMGIGLYSAITATGVSSIFYSAVGIIAILGGLLAIKNWLWPNGPLQLEVPEPWKPYIKRLISGISSPPGAFIVGFAISFLLLPCTSGPYIAILGLLTTSTHLLQAIGLLVLYNLIFIVPMVVITGSVYLGILTTAKIEGFRQRNMRLIKLLSGLLMLSLGAIMLASGQLSLF